MDVTVDIKTLFIILVLIALVILIVYAVFVLKKLLVTLDHTNQILEDVEVISEMASSRSQDLDGIIDDVVSLIKLKKSMSKLSSFIFTPLIFSFAIIISNISCLCFGFSPLKKIFSVLMKN